MGRSATLTTFETEQTMIVRTHMDSPVGRISITARTSESEQDALLAVLWPIENGRHRFSNVVDVPDPDSKSLLATAVVQLNEYFDGERTVFELPLAPNGTAFQLEAWEALRRIPFGETRSYSGQAALIGKPQAVRAIGAANGQNPLSIIVPCHRVIGANGSLTGFAGGLDAKRWLLNHERRMSGATLL
jgi:methylated-DNA-[protein]-cysteine S-methyltransferase